MLRGLVLLLLLANAGYFAWSQGFLLGYGVGPPEPGEPQRLAQQIHPETMRLLGVEEARKLEAQAAMAPPAKVCWQAGMFDDTQAQVLRSALESALPGGSWQLEPVVQPARWIIYMGKYDGAEGVAKKKAELRLLNVPNEPVRNPALEPGLSLGGYETQAMANGALNILSQRGVRTARVVQERAELHGQQLRLPQADDSLRALLDSVKPALAGKSLQPCAP